MSSNIRLDIPPEKVPKILTPEVLADLEAKYLENMKDEYKLWMSNTMKLEEEDWKRDKEPGLATNTIFSFWSEEQGHIQVFLYFLWDGVVSEKSKIKNMLVNIPCRP